MTEQTPGAIRPLLTEECWELVDAASVGRLGFVADGEVLIIPVNYVLDGDVIIRAAPSGLLSGLPGTRVSFEVDYHSAQGAGWSVLMHGSISEVEDPESVAVQHLERVRPWAGGDRSLLLRFSADSVAGRRVRRARN